MRRTDFAIFCSSRSWAENFNVSGGAAQEIVIPNLYQEGASFSLPDGSTATGTLVQVTAPDGTVSKTFVGSSGWTESFPIVTEDWSGGVKKRWSWTSYTQDNTSLSFILNPRAIETKVGDSASVRRTTIDYHAVSGYPNVALYGLVKDVIVYDVNGTSQLKKSHTEYNLDNAYVSRRIIGLPSETALYDHNNSLMSRVTFAYDEGNFSGTGQSISPIQHDSTNYSSGFIVGRGNLTSTTRWDATAPTNSSLAVTSSVRYNTAGLPVAQIDPLNRTVSIGYTDWFDDEVNRNTFAYPTVLTDPAGNSSTVKYRFDIGANVYATSPAPAGNSAGKTTSRIYDSLGRLERETVNNTGAYTRYVYPTNGIQSLVYSTITDVNGNGADAADEVLAESWLDGAGRTRMTRTEHPGSAGGWSASITEYDIMGRVKRQSVPTETDVNWNPAGDDAARGWLWTQAEYDWRGRVTRQINSDGTDKLFSYEGCGCAGGQVTTMQEELLAEGRRTQKVYEDILGRRYKNETLNWDGSVYSTTRAFFNGRDQETLIRQYAGADSSSTFQDTTMTYDGHGRLKTRHNPIEDAGTYTTYNYNPDDSVQSVVDPRGAVTNYAYNSRRLVEQISYSSPSAEIPAPPTVTFAYDNAGNRTQMTDGTGSTTYAYNQLSQITSETKIFAGLAGNYTLSYTYQLSGRLKSITDPFNASVTYQDDKAGRVTAIYGEGFLDVSTYAHNMKYTAFGALKQMNYGTDDNAQVDYQFDNRLRVSSYQAASSVVTGGFVRKATYEYYADSKAKKLNNLVESHNEQSFWYDHAGRIKQNQFGMKEKVTYDEWGNPTTELVRVYDQTLQYNAFGDMTSRIANIWSGTEGFNASYVNGRRQSGSGEPPFIYDAAGNLVDVTYAVDKYDRSKYEASGRVAESSFRYTTGGGSTTKMDITTTISPAYDGDGRTVKRVQTKVSLNRTNGSTSTEVTTEYYVNSSVLGKKITELDGQGAKTTTEVYAGNSLLAEQRNFPSSSEVDWKHADPLTGSYRMTNKSGQITAYTTPPSRVEYEALGGIVPHYDPYANLEEGVNPAPSNGSYKYGGDVIKPDLGCDWNGSPVSCDLLAFIRNYEKRFDEHPFGKKRPTKEPDNRMPKPSRFRGADNLLHEDQHRGLRQVKRWEDDSLVDRWEADFSDQQQDTDWKKISFIDQVILKKKVKQLLTPECLDYIKKLKDKARKMYDNAKGKENERDLIAPRSDSSQDILELFDSVTQEGGFYVTAKWVNSTISYAGQPKTVNLGNFHSWSNTRKDYWGRLAYDMAMNDSAIIAIHELIHFSFHDINLAMAVAELKGEQKSQSFSARVKEDTARASRYWGDELKRQLESGCKQE